MFRLATGADIARLNEIASHPEVFPYISDGTLLNFSTLGPSVLTFMSKHGALIFFPRGEEWELHTMFLPSGRGRHAYMVCRGIFTQMFDVFNAKAIVTFTPDDCPHARPPRTFGFKQVSHIDNYVRGCGASFWRVTENEWRRKCR